MSRRTESKFSKTMGRAILAYTLGGFVVLGGGLYLLGKNRPGFFSDISLKGEMDVRLEKESLAKEMASFKASYAKEKTQFQEQMKGMQEQFEANKEDMYQDELTALTNQPIVQAVMGSATETSK